VTVFTGMPNYPSGQFFDGYSYAGPWQEEYKGIKVFRSPGILRGGGGNFRLLLNFLSFPILACLFILFRCRKKFDAIFVYEPSPVTVALPAILFKWVTGSPILMWVLDLWPESLVATGAIKSRFFLAIVESVVRFIYRNCDRVLIQSKGFQSVLQNLGVPSQKLFYFPSWAETIYKPNSNQIVLPDSVHLPHGFRVMFAGNIGAAQDFDTIIRAAELLKNQANIHWVILGDGRRSQWVKEQIKSRELDNQVHLLGQFPLETMPAFYAQADALLVTLRRNEVFALTIPGKVQSYLASGRPIVAALDGEGARIIQEANAGMVCATEDPGALAKIVSEMAALPTEVREKMGRNGKQYSRVYFDQTTLLDRLEGWIRQLAFEPNKEKISS